MRVTDWISGIFRVWQNSDSTKREKPNCLSWQLLTKAANCIRAKGQRFDRLSAGQVLKVCHTGFNEAQVSNGWGIRWEHTSYELENVVKVINSLTYNSKYKCPCTSPMSGNHYSVGSTFFKLCYTKFCITKVSLAYCIAMWKYLVC